MAPLPKRKFSTSRKLKRFATRKTSLTNSTVCQYCGHSKLPHLLCPQCHKK